MKFSLATIALIEAAKNGKGGKHGGVDMSNDRFNWKVPKCIANPETCVKSQKFSAQSGSITIDQSNYKSFENSMFQINVGPDRRVFLKFDRDHKFGIEWHAQCGYDKLHIFKGNADEFDENNRIARFCGPKNGKKPFDGAYKLKPAKGVMPMWDTRFNTRSSEVIVAVDFDQDFDGYSGFTLDWTSEVVTMPDYSSFDETTEWAKDTILSHLDFFDWATEKGPAPLKNSVKTYFKNVKARAEKTNLSCNKNFGDNVSVSTRGLFEATFDMESTPATVKAILGAMTDLMAEYLSDCPAGQSASWSKKEQRILQKLKKNLA